MILSLLQAIGTPPGIFADLYRARQFQANMARNSIARDRDQFFHPDMVNLTNQLGTCNFGFPREKAAELPRLHLRTCQRF